MKWQYIEIGETGNEPGPIRRHIISNKITGRRLASSSIIHEKNRSNPFQKLLIINIGKTIPEIIVINPITHN